MLLSSAVLTLLPLTALASPLSSRSALYTDCRIKHSWSGSIPSSMWKYHSTSDPSTLLNLRLGLRPSNFDTLLGHLSETSDPFHERYGKHLSKEQVDELMRPRAETVQEVKEWLNWHGVEDDAVSTASERSVTITIPISLAEAMLNTTYHVYVHTETDETIIRTLEYSLPRHLHDHINLVSPTTYFETTRSMGMTVSKGATPRLTRAVTPSASCASTITPTCLQDLYNTAGYVPTQTATNKIGITGFQEQFASLADLTTFTKRFLPAATNATFTVQQVNGGGNNQKDPGVLANLDTQYATGIAWPTPIIFYSTGGVPPSNPDSVRSTNSPFLDWLEFVSTVTDEELPSTFVTSYGDEEQTVPADYATEVCNLLATLGLRGTSVISTSGAAGVGAGTCKTNNGTNKILFQPVFPASCPFITAVGATTGIAPEIAANQFSSGGGFSNLFPQPSYQSSAVNLFLNLFLGGTNAGLFNPAGRAYPDVSAQSQQFQFISGGALGAATGSSSASFAGIIALLNDFKLAKDGTTLGFLNPLLYANPAALNDIVTGRNKGCGTTGFNAGAGWDPVTGLGTPDFVKLQAVV